MSSTRLARRLAVVGAAFALAGCSADAPTTPSTAAGHAHAPAGLHNSAEVNQALAMLRQHTAGWHNRAKAEAAGYVAEVGCSDERTEGLSAADARGMGYHTANLDILFDDHSTLLEPELIVYSLEPTSGKLKIAGFDYFIPGPFYPGPDSPDYPGTPPLLGGLGTPMMWSTAHGGWVAHIWPWMHNPDGMFQNFNPNVPICECEISPTTSLCTPA